jgi:DNA-binding transcriptional regulator YiaG
MRANRLQATRRRLLENPDFAARVAVEKTLLELDLHAAREHSGLPQREVAARLGTSQENVSRIERQQDVLVSTLIDLVQAQGGTLEINALFDGERVPLLRPVADPRS